MEPEKLGPRDKALAINLDQRKYGTFAEIGAGQEVVRWFFRVGGAAGTIAKSMSAYDMTVSDAIYGSCQRYVSRERLNLMLDHEYSLLIERLAEKRGEQTEFFAFADTVRARGYLGSTECHGWMGVRFQSAPQKEPSQIIIHVRMLDRENEQQQEALGIVGVNLLFGAFVHYHAPERVLSGLLDQLSPERIEVDMVKFSGPDFAGVDPRLMSLKLVELGLTNATMFSADGEVLQPSEVLHKRPVLVERGNFRPVTHVHLDLLECARGQFIDDPTVAGEEPVVLAELTLRSLLRTGDIDYADFLARAELLSATGATVLISNYLEYYRLAAYLRCYTQKKIGLAMGLPALKSLFDEAFYEHLDGGILESFGRLFNNNLRLYVYPFRDPQTGQIMTVHKLRVAPNLHALYQHICENGYVEAIDCYNREYLSIFSNDVLMKIRDGESGWEHTVPDPVAKLIKERGFFGWRPETHSESRSLAPAL